MEEKKKEGKLEKMKERKGGNQNYKVTP